MNRQREENHRRDVLRHQFQSVFPPVCCNREGGQATESKMGGLRPAGSGTSECI